ncbi:dockerin type I repeat-containing protein, partial [bacterium]|nr:dockerin type I repeat-containing protein [bacterium]
MLVSIRAFANNDVFACGDYGYIRHFDGSEWTLTELETPSTLRCIDGVSHDDLWVGGPGGFLAHFDGALWTTVSGVTNSDITDFHVIATNEIYGSTRQGELIFYDGDKWELVYSPSLSRFNGVCRGTDDTIWLAGDAGVVMSYDSSVAPTPTPEPCLNHGDVTLDSEVTAADAQLTFMIALGSHTPSFEEECAADCNGDSEVTAGDAQEVFMVALGSQDS